MSVSGNIEQKRARITKGIGKEDENGKIRMEIR